MECTTFDIITKISTILIAAINSGFVIFYLFKNYGSTKKDKEIDRRIIWIKTLILDQNMKHYYNFFDDSQITLNKILNSQHLTDEEKQLISNEFSEHCATLRKNFLDLFIAIDNALYLKLQNKIDDVENNITLSLFDGGINISHKPKYDELIDSKIRATKTDALKIIFEYNGQ